MSHKAIQRVAQNMPPQMLQSLSQAAQTPHYPTTPGAASSVGYGAAHLNTPYTPSGQTPFITPYQTPLQTPSHHMYNYSQNSMDWGKVAQDFAKQSGYVRPG